MSELSREQITKALECCASEEYICNQCPIDEKTKDDCECGKVVARNALTLINELTEEIEDLEAQCRYYAEAYHSVKADTVRKMQERLMAEERIFEAYGTRWKVIYSSAIDQIAKEMLEGENAQD